MDIRRIWLLLRSLWLFQRISSPPLLGRSHSRQIRHTLHRHHVNHLDVPRRNPQWYAVSHNFEGTINVPFFGEYQTQVVLAATGFAIYGVGCEIAGVTVTKILVKWFTGHELALAMGLQVALARIGTACTLAYSLPFAMGKHIEYVDTHSVGDFFANINAGIINGLTSLKDFLGFSSGVQASVALGAAMLCIGMIAYLVYCVMDKKEDASAAAIQAENEEGFKFSDLKNSLLQQRILVHRCALSDVLCGRISLLEIRNQTHGHEIQRSRKYGRPDSCHVAVWNNLPDADFRKHLRQVR